jgi:hypothetical protein
MENKKSLGQSIDELIVALKDLDENSRIIAIKAVVEHLNIPIMRDDKQLKSLQSIDLNNIDTLRQQFTPPQGATLDIQSLKEIKQPANSIEMACVVAFYLSNHAPENEKTDSITKIEIEKYFKQAKFPLPKVIQQVLVDAKSSGYFDSAERGKYKLNPVGYNLVAHKLPRVKK